MISNIKNEIKLRIPACAAKVDAKLSRILGPLGVNPGQFCTKFNEASANKPGISNGDLISCGIIVKPDKTFDINVYGIMTSKAILKAANAQKGLQNPGKDNPLFITQEDVERIAKNKMHYVKIDVTLDAMKAKIISTAKSCGVSVK